MTEEIGFRGYAPVQKPASLILYLKK